MGFERIAIGNVRASNAKAGQSRYLSARGDLPCTLHLHNQLHNVPLAGDISMDIVIC